MGLQNYHDTNNAFPPGCTSPANETHNAAWGAVSFYVALYPFIEQSARYQIVMGRGDAANGFSGWNDVWRCGIKEFQAPISMLGCPSDAAGTAPSFINQAQAGSYVGSRGDVIMSLNENDINTRGFFKGGLGADPGAWNWGRGVQCRTFSALTDGTSNTIAISETAVATAASSNKVKGGVAKYSAGSPNSCLAMVDANDRNIMTGGQYLPDGRGSIHTDGRPGILNFTTVLPPNSPSCTTDISNPGYMNRGYLSASSYHAGGVNGVYADGSVHFISDTVDCGSNLGSADWVNADPTGKSPFGVWGALGSIAGGETTTL